jgi:acylphosphatase
MDEKFGIITIVKDRRLLVVYEGNERELSDMIGVIKRNLSDSAEMRLVDKEEYETCKENIIELRKLLAK